MQDNLFIDTDFRQVNCHGQYICGDTFLLRQFPGGKRTVMILSDGMGHGVKANILSTLTATMLLDCTGKHRDVRETGERILATLPVCSVRKISYSTFTCADIDHETGEVTIVEHGNPHVLLFRKQKPEELIWISETSRENDGRERIIHTTKFKCETGDRILILSDGVTQSGQGSDRYPFGWSSQGVIQTVSQLLKTNPQTRSSDLASRILCEATRNDNGRPSDDQTCVCVHIRTPRRLLLVSCPPSSKQLYTELMHRIDRFRGRKVVCGYPVAEIVAFQQGIKVPSDPDIPWSLPGIDLVTEGIITLNTVYDLLEQTAISKEDTPAERLAKMLMASDEIHLLIGNKRKAFTNIYTPDEFEMRRKILKRIARTLETKYKKQVTIAYL